MVTEHGKHDTGLGPHAPATESGADFNPQNHDKDHVVIMSANANSGKLEINETATEAAESLTVAKSWTLIATLTGASFLNTFSVQAAVIILPSIAKDLSIPETHEQWIVSAYAIIFACFLLVWGSIADIYGKKKVFILGSAWVTITTAVNPFIKNEIAFYAMRGLQGLGAAANVPTAVGILGTTFPPGKMKTYAFSIYSAGMPLGSVMGNIFSGILASYIDWRWIFGVIALLALLTTVAGFFVIPASPVKQSPNRKSTTVDWIGAILVTSGLLCLLVALTEGNVVGWSTPRIPALVAVSAVLIAAFIFWEHHLDQKSVTRSPMLKPSIFTSSWRFTAVILTMLFIFASFNGFLVFVTYFFQLYQGLSPIQTSLRFIPTGVTGVVTAAVIIPQLLRRNRVSSYAILVFATICVSISSLLFAVPIPSDTSYFAYGLPAMVLSTLAADSSYPCLALYVSQVLPQQDQALGGALLTAAGQLGRALGLAIATAVQVVVVQRARREEQSGYGGGEASTSTTLPWDGPSLCGLRAAHWLNFGFGAASFVVAVFGLKGFGTAA